MPYGGYIQALPDYGRSPTEQRFILLSAGNNIRAAHSLDTEWTYVCTLDFEAGQQACFTADGTG